MADIKVKIGADASEFERAMNGMKSHMNRLAAITGGAVIGFKAISSIASTAAGAIKSASMAFADFAKSSSQKAADMEMLEVSFETLTGSAEKAKDLIAEFRKEAQKSPLTTSDYANAGKTLMAFGVEAADVMGTLRMLGDVSMGDSERFGRLSLAFAQTTAAGKLMGQEVNQFVQSGFNPLQEISLRTGRSMMELRKAMEDGAISSDMVSAAFKSATSEGGIFFRAIDRGAETMTGKMAQVTDSIDTLQIAFGEGMNKGLKVALDAIGEKLPQFQESFTRVGVTFGNAISDGINGESEKLVAIGKFIGDLIKEGIRVSLLAVGTEVSGGIVDMVSKYTQPGVAYRAFHGDKKVDKQVANLKGYGREQTAMDAMSAIKRVADSFNRTFGYGDKNAVLQGAGGSQFRYAQPGESSPFRDPATGFRLIEILTKIESNTSPGPAKAFAY